MRPRRVVALDRGGRCGDFGEHGHGKVSSSVVVRARPRVNHAVGQSPLVRSKTASPMDGARVGFSVPSDLGSDASGRPAVPIDPAANGIRDARRSIVRPPRRARDRANPNIPVTRRSPNAAAVPPRRAAPVAPHQYRSPAGRGRAGRPCLLRHPGTGPPTKPSGKYASLAPLTMSVASTPGRSDPTPRATMQRRCFAVCRCRGAARQRLLTIMACGAPLSRRTRH